MRGIERVELHADLTILAKLACAFARTSVVALADGYPAPAAFAALRAISDRPSDDSFSALARAGSVGRQL
jgi:hypothetical protein